MGHNEYFYCGPVKEFDTIIDSRWKAKTVAPSEKKARSNLAYRYKMEHGKTPNTRIELPGEIKMIRREEN